MQPFDTTRWSAFESRHPAREAARRMAAACLTSVSAALGRLALRCAAPAVRHPSSEPQIEFHAEAGAPEGALYLDGKFVGWVSGVTRL